MPDDIDLDPTDPETEPVTLESEISGLMGSGEEGTVPAADPDSPDIPQGGGEDGSGEGATPSAPVSPEGQPDPFAAPIEQASDTVDLFGLQVSREDAQSLIAAYQFAASLTPAQYEMLQRGETVPPVAPATPSEWDEVDPAVRQTIDSQGNELAQLRAQFEQAQATQAAAAARSQVQTGIDDFKSSFGLDDAECERIVTRLRDSQLLPSFVAQAGGDVAEAVKRGLYTAMWTDPVHQQKAQARSAAADAQIAQRKQRANGVSGSSGSTVSPLNQPAARRDQPAPRNASEQRAANDKAMFDALAAELRQAVSNG
jgi:hypothetical protein